MRCPFCGFPDQKVLDSRPGIDGETIRRRRECNACSRRFTTFERSERPRLFVVKRDGSRQEFVKDKCLHSMLIACRKRRVAIEDLKDAVDTIERELFQEVDDEVASSIIGDKVMVALRDIDTVAYVRFSSVYREFETVSDFQEILDTVSGRKRRTAKVGAGA